MKLSEDSRFEKVNLRYVGPIVYIFHVGDEIVYIGSSSNGLRRPFDSNHRMAPLLELSTIELSITFLDTVEDARKLELDLIKEHQPIGNRAGTEDFKRKNPFYGPSPWLRMKRHIY